MHSNALLHYKNNLAQTISRIGMIKKIFFLILVSLSAVTSIDTTPPMQKQVKRRKEKKVKRKKIDQEIAQVRKKMRHSNKEFKQAKKVSSDNSDLKLLHAQKINSLNICTCKKSTPEMIQNATNELEAIEVATTNKKKSIQKFQHAKRKECALLNDKRKQLLRERREV